MLGERPGGESERGQLLVITALVLAIVLVGLALVLNSAIYTENLSTRESTDSVAATGAFESGEAAVRSTIRQVNANDNDSHDEVNQAFDDALDDIENDTTQRYAERGTAYDFTVLDRTNGTNLRHTNASRSFVSGGTDDRKGDWLLAHDVPRVRSHRMTVTREDLYTDTTLADLDDFNDEAFHVRIEDTNGNVWEVYVLDDDENVTVIGGPPSELNDDSLSLDDLTFFDDEGCRVAAAETEQVRIDFAAGTVGLAGADGQYCPGLDFEDELTGELSIYHRNADDAGGESRSGGTYELTIATSNYDGDHFYDVADDQSPYAASVIYSARVESRYSTAGITHQRTTRVYPGTEGYTS
jgi:hypothetical protein